MSSKFPPGAIAVGDAKPVPIASIGASSPSNKEFRPGRSTVSAVRYFAPLDFLVATNAMMATTRIITPTMAQTMPITSSVSSPDSVLEEGAACWVLGVRTRRSSAEDEIFETSTFNASESSPRKENSVFPVLPSKLLILISCGVTVRPNSVESFLAKSSAN